MFVFGIVFNAAVAVFAIGTVRLGSFPTASEYLLPSALAALAVSHPSVEILLDEGEPDELTPRVTIELLPGSTHSPSSCSTRHTRSRSGKSMGICSMCTHGLTPMVHIEPSSAR